MNSYSEITKVNMSATAIMVIDTMIEGMKISKRKIVTLKELKTVRRRLMKKI